MGNSWKKILSGEGGEEGLKVCKKEGGGEGVGNMDSAGQRSNNFEFSRENLQFGEVFPKSEGKRG